MTFLIAVTSPRVLQSLDNVHVSGDFRGRKTTWKAYGSKSQRMVKLGLQWRQILGSKSTGARKSGLHFGRDAEHEWPQGWLPSDGYPEGRWGVHVHMVGYSPLLSRPSLTGQPEVDNHGDKGPWNPNKPRRQFDNVFHQQGCLHLTWTHRLWMRRESVSPLIWLFHYLGWSCFCQRKFDGYR